MNQDTETQLRALADEIATEVGALAPDIRTIISVGDPATEILKGAKEEIADLIVMGLHANGTTFGRRLGSVAYGVLCLVKAPVFALPSRLHGSERLSFSTQTSPQPPRSPLLLTHWT